MLWQRFDFARQTTASKWGLSQPVAMLVGNGQIDVVFSARARSERDNGQTIHDTG
jgi:glutamate synthase domain-containing protein 1